MRPHRSLRFFLRRVAIFWVQNYKKIPNQRVRTRFFS